MRCARCGNSFNPIDLSAYQDTEGVRSLPDWIQTAMGPLCPRCMSEMLPTQSGRLRSLQANSLPTSLTDFRPDFTVEPRTPPVEPKGPIEEMTKKPAFRLMFGLLASASVIVFVYSAVSKFLWADLPPFPFYPYIITYALLTFFYRSLHGAVFPMLLLVVLANFGSATFRGTFYSHFSSAFWPVFITVMFVLSSLSSLKIFADRFFERFRQPGQITTGAVFMAVLIAVAFYAGLVSPFYLGTINPGPYGSDADPEPYRFDGVFMENLTTLVIEDTPMEAARRYFVDGKRKAALGTRDGFRESIKFYDKALELLPAFTTALAEKAYSYASIGRLQADVRLSEGIVDAAFEHAEHAWRALEIAEEASPSNPSIHAVKAIVAYYVGDADAATEHVEHARQLAEESGYSDRLLEAMSVVERKKLDKLSYLLAIQSTLAELTYDEDLRDVYSNNAYLHNLLGVNYYRVGNKASAKKMLERATDLNPNYGEAHLNLALVSSAGDVASQFELAGTRDGNVLPLANRYSELFNAQKWLRRLFGALLVMLFVHSAVAANQHGNVLPLANRYSKLFNVQKWLRRLFEALLVMLFVHSAVAANQQRLGQIKTIRLRYTLVFVAVYAVFEWNVHVHTPVNSLTHSFPTRFPFF